MRDKLEKDCKKEKNQFTPEAIGDAIKKIHEKIATAVASGYYKVIPNKPLSVFAENENPAEISSKVKKIARTLQSIPTAVLDALGQAVLKVPSDEDSQSNTR